MRIFRIFGTRRFSKGWFLGLVLGLASTSVLVYATVVNVPNTFTSGTTISAAQMNANFQAIAGCPSDMTAVGTFCIDTFEASVRDAATGGNPLDSTACSANGDDCTNVIFAQSQSGVLPAVDFTWFQAQQACANVGKRLPTNAEWQMAAAGTVAANCNRSTSTLAATDANPTCISNYNVINMVGNVGEWVADWIPTPAMSGDVSAGSGSYRGGDAGDPGASTTFAFNSPLNTGLGFGGFRCVR